MINLKNSLLKLRNKVIIVTGGSTGIGLAISKKLACEGAIVIICSRNRNNLMSAIKELRQISTANHGYYVADISNLTEVNLFANWVQDNYDEINGLVNCAGILGTIGNTVYADMPEFFKAININFMGTVYMCSVFASLFSFESVKKIVNFSGGGATSPLPYYSAYAASKAAVVRFTENLAIELAENDFEINCISPGFVATAIHNGTLDAGPGFAGEDYYENTIKQLEQGGTPPEKAADLTSFLLSDDSIGISGKLISAAWDDWSNDNFKDLLKCDKDFATLRRIDNKTYFKK